MLSSLFGLGGWFVHSLASRATPTAPVREDRTCLDDAVTAIADGRHFDSEALGKGILDDRSQRIFSQLCVIARVAACYRNAKSDPDAALQRQGGYRVR